MKLADLAGKEISNEFPEHITSVKGGDAIPAILVPFHHTYGHDVEQLPQGRGDIRLGSIKELKLEAVVLKVEALLLFWSMKLFCE